MRKKRKEKEIQQEQDEGVKIFGAESKCKKKQ